MLKKFFISMLGAMAGFWLSVIIIMFGSIFVVMVLATKSCIRESETIKGDKILRIDLSGEIPERQGGASLSDLMSYMEDPTDDLESITKAIRKAADDKEVKGIYLDCGGSSLGVASRSEIVGALTDFRKSGKFIYAYADNFEQGDYYIASVADSIFLNPVGSLNVHGLSSTTVFYKNVLDKIGIDVNVVRVGSFKSAVEPYMRMDMSAESKMQTQVFINEIWNEIASTIADKRYLPGGIADVDMWADSLSFVWAPERYVEKKAISSLRYRAEVEDLLKKELGADSDDDINYVSPSDYISGSMDAMLKADKKHIAVLYAVGSITENGETGIVSSTMVPEIERLTKDKNVGAMVLRVNSGGGSAFASEQIWEALERFKAAGKPLYVSMGDYAASGGYYISCGADKIFCDPTTLTGSIGIFGILPNGERLMKQKIGLGFETVSTNKNADFPSFTSAPTAEQLNAMQQYVNRGYETFTSRVAQGRDMPVDSVKAIGGGRVWAGVSALTLGLVDQLGSLHDAVDAIAKESGIEATDVVSYPNIELTFLQSLLNETKKGISVDLDAMDIEQAKEYLDEFSTIKNMAPLQARMEKIIIK